jgi:hypothetical protein
VMTNPSVPRQLQPGIRPAQGQTFLPPSSLQPSAPDYKDLPRLPTPGALPNTFGRQNSVEDSEDDAYGGAYLGPESPPEQRTLQVRRSRSTGASGITDRIFRSPTCDPQLSQVLIPLFQTNCGTLVEQSVPLVLPNDFVYWF